MSGYTTGAACHVFTSQLTHILGIKNKVDPGLFQIPRVNKGCTMCPLYMYVTLTEKYIHVGKHVQSSEKAPSCLDVLWSQLI